MTAGQCCKKRAQSAEKEFDYVEQILNVEDATPCWNTTLAQSENVLSHLRNNTPPPHTSRRRGQLSKLVNSSSVTSCFEPPLKDRSDGVGARLAGGLPACAPQEKHKLYISMCVCMYISIDIYIYIIYTDSGARTSQSGSVSWQRHIYTYITIYILRHSFTRHATGSHHLTRTHRTRTHQPSFTPPTERSLAVNIHTWTQRPYLLQWLPASEAG